MQLRAVNTHKLHPAYALCILPRMDDLLKRIGWTQAEFARQLGANLATVNRWCRHPKDTLPYRLAMLYLNLLAERMGK